MANNRQGPVFHRLFPALIPDDPVRLNLNEYPDANENLTLAETEMRWSRTVFDAGYQSDFEQYSHYYWVYIESGELTLSFETGDQILVYRRGDNSEESVRPATSVLLNPGDLIVMVNINVSALNSSKGETTIMTVGYVNTKDPSPCHGGCWLP